MSTFEKRSLFVLLAAMLAIACGDDGDDDGTVDAGTGDAGGDVSDDCISAAPLLQYTLAEATERVADTWIADNPALDMAWDWGEGVLAFGMMEVAEVTGDTRYRDYIQTYVEFHQGRDDLVIDWSDRLTPALSAALLLQRSEAEVTDIVGRAIEYITDIAPRASNQGILHLGLMPDMLNLADLWVDSLFHLGPLLARYAEITDDSSFLDEAVSQTLIFARVLQDPASDLITHAWKDLPDDVQVPPFEDRLFWARGNSWMLATMVDLLAVLPESHPDHAELSQRTLDLEAAVRATQSDSGLYHTLLLDPETYLETAGSGLITYAMARGARLGIFGAETAQAAQRGVDGLLTVLVPGQEEGAVEVDCTSLGTLPIGFAYPDVPREAQVSYGVGAWLLTASEFLRADSARAQ